MIHVKLVAMGCIVSELDMFRVKRWKSNLFTIDQEVKRYILPPKADLRYWGYSDKLLKRVLPLPYHGKEDCPDLIFYILDAPIQNNFFSRILSENRIVISYYEVNHILHEENIPLENLLISLIYSYTLLYLANRKRVLTMKGEERIVHDHREGCLYDMCGNKEDVIYSSVHPIICEPCKAYLMQHGVAVDDIEIASNELKRLKRNLYYRMVHYLRSYPDIVFVLTCSLSIILNFVASNQKWAYAILICAIYTTVRLLIHYKH